MALSQKARLGSAHRQVSRCIESVHLRSHGALWFETQQTEERCVVLMGH